MTRPKNKRPNQTGRRLRDYYRTTAHPDLERVMELPPPREDIQAETAPPWERHPIPWDHVVPRRLKVCRCGAEWYDQPDRPRRCSACNGGHPDA